MIIAHHIILTGYGHWLPNDPRGSLSSEFRNVDLRVLGEIHHGRKKTQPSVREIRSFYEKAQSLLKYPVLWFDAARMQVIGDAFGEVIRHERLTCYACAVLRNHAHVVIRRHRLRHSRMLELLKAKSKEALVKSKLVPPGHPVWSLDPYVAFKDTTRAVRAAIDYVEGNFVKHHTPRQDWNFLALYDNWPFHKH